MSLVLDKYNYNLNKVAWGYRDKFRSIIEKLIDEGFIGPENQANTEVFFGFLSRHSGSYNDNTAHQFLLALNSRHKWILKNPHLFRQWCRTGEILAGKKHFAGSMFFLISGNGGLGKTPAETKQALTHINALADCKLDLALGFIKNYKNLVWQLDPKQLNVFVQEAEEVFRRSEKAGCDFIEGKLESSDVYIRRITSEARLSDNREAIRRIVRAISGKTVEVDNLGKLDSDELLMRGSRIVGLSEGLYLPLRISALPTPEQNRRFYHLAAVIYSGCQLFKGFAACHAEYGFSNIEEYLRRERVPSELMHKAGILFELCEYYRITCSMRQLFPGSIPLLDWGIGIEFQYNPEREQGDKILKQALLNQFKPDRNSPSCTKELFLQIEEIAEKSSLFTDTAAYVKELFKKGRLDNSSIPVHLRRLSFWADPTFLSEISMPSLDNTAADLSTRDDKDSASDMNGKDTESAGIPIMPSENAEKSGDAGDKKSDKKNSIKAGYVYKEWNGIRGEYYRNWCLLREKRQADTSHLFGSDLSQYENVDKIKAVFERIKPDTFRKEKNLYDGDAVNIDKLIDYLILRKARIAGEENFYEKPVIKERDLAVVILIDISGSTGSVVEESVKVLDLEKRAAAVLSDGLHLIGDRFAVCGFTGNGREKCEFMIFKDFEDEWGRETKDCLFSVYPGTSTRIGVALRHAGAKLANITCRRKLILLVTDGEPMDSEYDPNTGYAHLDVRKTCYENSDKGIDTFAVITDDKHKETFLQMFPRNNYIVIKNTMELPSRLSQFFMSLTM